MRIAILLIALFLCSCLTPREEISPEAKELRAIRTELKALRETIEKRKGRR